MQKFKQSSIVFEKPGILSENLNTLTSSNYPTVQYLLLKLRTHFLPTNVYKKVCGIFLNFVQILSYLQKNKKDLVSIHSCFTFLLITQDLNKIKQIPNTLSQTLLSRKHAQNFSKNIKLCGSWSLSKFSIFETKNLVSWKQQTFALIQASDFA